MLAKFESFTGKRLQSYDCFSEFMQISLKPCLNVLEKVSKWLTASHQRKLKGLRHEGISQTLRGGET